MGTKPWKGAHFGGAVKPATNNCEEVQECSLPEIELALESDQGDCKNNKRNRMFTVQNIGPNNILAGTVFNVVWTGLPEGAEFNNVSQLTTISEDGTQLTAADIIIASDVLYTRSFGIDVYITDTGCVAPFGAITCTITTDDYTLLNEGNQFVITYTP